MSRFVILSGPSCIGKSPLTRALAKLRPDLWSRLQSPVLYNCRAPRPGEVDGQDYHFRSREYLESLRSADGFLVLDVRNDVQALAMADVWALLESGTDAFFEGNPYIAAALLDALVHRGVPVLSMFMSPVTREELMHLRSQGEDQAAAVVADIMRRKLLRRTARHKSILSLPDLEDIEARCGAAFRELSYAPRFQWVLANHDGEDSENWDAFYHPIGDARKSLLDFVSLLEGEPPRFAETWDDVAWDAG